MSTTTKKDLIDRIAQETNQKRTVVKKIVQCFLDNVIDELSRGNRLEFRDFGVFEIRHRAPRVAQNPKTLERVPVPAKRTVKFKVGRLMKMALELHTDDEGGGNGAGDDQRVAQSPFGSQIRHHQDERQRNRSGPNERRGEARPPPVLEEGHPRQARGEDEEETDVDLGQEQRGGQPPDRTGGR